MPNWAFGKVEVTGTRKGVKSFIERFITKVILIGQRQAVYIAIHKCDVGQRNTVLADRIVAYYNREMSKRVA